MAAERRHGYGKLNNKVTKGLTAKYAKHAKGKFQVAVEITSKSQ
jgi:hypothetical protein